MVKQQRKQFAFEEDSDPEEQIYPDEPVEDSDGSKKESGDEMEKDSVQADERKGDAEKDGDDQDGELNTDEPNLDVNEKENDSVLPDQAVKTPVSALKQLGIDSVQKPSSSTPLSSKLDRKPVRPARGKAELKENADQEEFEKVKLILLLQLMAMCLMTLMMRLPPAKSVGFTCSV